MKLRGSFFDQTDKRLLSAAVPVFFTLIAEPVYILVDTAIVGRISTAALGGLALAGSVMIALTWICGFLATGLTTQVAQRLGAGDRDGAETAFAQGVWLAGALSIVATIIVELAGPLMLEGLGGEREVLKNAETYLRISGFGIPAILFSLLALGWLRGSSNFRTPLVVAVVASITNVILEVLFVYGFDWGISGSAWGTVAVQWAAVLWLLRIVKGNVRLQRLRFGELRGLLAIGGAMLVRTGAMVATIIGATSVATRAGKLTLASHQVATQTFTFLALAIDALAISTQTLFAEEMGRGDATTLRSTARRLVRLGVIAGLLIGLVLAVVSPWLPGLFSPDVAVQNSAQVALLLLALMQVSGAFVFTLDGILMGANKFAQLAAVAVAGGCAFAVVVSLRTIVPGSRIAQVWIGMNVWMVVRAIGNALIAHRFFRRVKAL